MTQRRKVFQREFPSLSTFKHTSLLFTFIVINSCKLAPKVITILTIRHESLHLPALLEVALPRPMQAVPSLDFALQ